VVGGAYRRVRPTGPRRRLRCDEPGAREWCTLIDAIWSAEPFANHAAFVTHVRQVTGGFVRQRQLSTAERDRIVTAPTDSDVARKGDPQMDDGCATASP